MSLSSSGVERVAERGEPLLDLLLVDEPVAALVHVLEQVRHPRQLVLQVVADALEDDHGLLLAHAAVVVLVERARAALLLEPRVEVRLEAARLHGRVGVAEGSQHLIVFVPRRHR